MVDTKTITIRIPFVCSNFLEAIQGEDSLNATIVRAINRYQYLRAYSMEELRGKFTSDEWFFFLRSTDRVIPEGPFRYNPDSLIAYCKDAEKLDNSLATDLSVDLNVLAAKIKELTAAQIEAIYSRVEQRRLKGSSFDGWEYF